MTSETAPIWVEASPQRTKPTGLFIHDLPSSPNNLDRSDSVVGLNTTLGVPSEGTCSYDGLATTNRVRAPV